MKKLFSLLAMVFLLTFAVSNTSVAQDQPANSAADTTQTITQAPEAVAEAATPAIEEEVQQKKSFHYALKEKFIEGGAGFMTTVLLCLILGLALAIERIIYLTLSTTNSRKLLNQVETALNQQGLKAAQDICKNTRGPLASVFWQGLDKYDEGIDSVEKSLVSYGSVATARLEKGLAWISLFIALAPMLGFMGTVIGMIQAFDQIAIVGEMSPQVVAGGMKVALLTTVFGLIVAVILQIFYNYILTKIESIVTDMEDSSISFLDIVASKMK
ncbi:MAG: MotA/TolQ/ExbB proton channel family protein [Bacteroidales bacterium]|nr:MotA/TolQ/ExbB proton channel family protein [Bacteroidales bacterium]MDD2204509.1 MotA/TolQ/ExbB proton channel family protein [Bacteroidales bacterium]MDD3151425.1 MotA/TolQ/ExbB proton channel family protein [Bacteroidales bacterium]MDD3914623.1 MotA/TolQ/ExbB proton channel family protein [Bacteroidales bacterium]MDD4633808.1 MotA/TolQ/ExbB proton channel family protein [Bacteroidales bacterium]